MGNSIRNLVLVLGDQLDEESSALDGFDAQQDAVWMAEVSEESTHVWSHKARIALFLSGMRHLRDRLRKKGFKVMYRQLDDAKGAQTLANALKCTIHDTQPKRLIMTEPSDFRVRESLKATAQKNDVGLEIRPDEHFLSTLEDFAEYASGRKELRLEYFYRKLRREQRVLMTDDKPVGDRWNFDKENRGSFGKTGPDGVPSPMRFKTDATTKEVLKLVQKHFPGHPGSLEHFDWPLTPDDAQRALNDFIEKRLPLFGKYQDAMWTNEPLLYHSRLSAALNLKLLHPRDVIAAAAKAYEEGHAPLPAAEGFIRQILGWREYVRGIYWTYMPEYAERNFLEADRHLPHFYWTGETEMNCLRDVIGQTLKYGYAHHIQRLMVTGLFALLLGVLPKEVHEWYLAVYVDAVEWVELPNTLGMSQFADGGVMASKPYAATGKYIQRMSNYCEGCRYNPAKATGENACPFTTLYWDFLKRNEKKLAKNQRMSLQLRNISRKSPSEWKEIRKQAKQIVEQTQS